MNDLQFEFCFNTSRFELPLNILSLSTLTPLDYLSTHAFISKAKNQTYTKVKDYIAFFKHSHTKIVFIHHFVICKYKAIIPFKIFSDLKSLRTGKLNEQVRFYVLIFVS